MSKKAADGSKRRLGWSSRRGYLALITLVAIGGGVMYGVKHRTALRQPSPIVDGKHKLQRPSPEALGLLSELRTRFAQESSQAPASGSAVQSSPLLPGLVEDFERDPAGYFPHFSAALGKPAARVVLPAQASAPFQVADAASGLRIQAKLEDVRDTAAEMVDGYAGYRHAHESGATVLRRAMPDGTEDFFSFTEPPSNASITYDVKFDSGVTGLRLVANTFEALDNNGTPRLRVAPPYIVGADGGWLEAKSSTTGPQAPGQPRPA